MSEQRMLATQQVFGVMCLLQCDVTSMSAHVCLPPLCNTSTQALDQYDEHKHFRDFALIKQVSAYCARSKCSWLLNKTWSTDIIHLSSAHSWMLLVQHSCVPRKV